MIKIYDTLYIGECETENTKLDVLLSETNKASEVGNEVEKAIKDCEKKYNRTSYLTYGVGVRSILHGNTCNKWVDGKDGKQELVVDHYYDKWYITIDWGSYSHFIRIAFDTEKEYNDYLKG